METDEIKTAGEEEMVELSRLFEGNLLERLKAAGTGSKIALEITKKSEKRKGFPMES